MRPSVTLGFGVEGSFLELSVNSIGVSSVFWLEEERFSGARCVQAPSTRRGTFCHVPPPTVLAFPSA